MSIIDDVGRGLIRWTPKILEASADDIDRFGPQAARVRALLNFIPTMSDDAAEIGRAALRSTADAAVNSVRSAADTAVNAGRSAAKNAVDDAAFDASYYAPWYVGIQNLARAETAQIAANRAARGEVVSDLITPEVYRTMTNPMASASALDRLAGRAPESFIPIARDLGERGLVSAPSDIVSALRISKLPPHVQPLVTGLVDSGLTLEEAIAAARALS